MTILLLGAQEVRGREEGPLGVLLLGVLLLGVLSCTTTCGGMKSSGILICRLSLNHAGLSCSHTAYMLRTHCLTRSRIDRHCLSLQRNMLILTASFPSWSRKMLRA